MDPEFASEPEGSLLSLFIYVGIPLLVLFGSWIIHHLGKRSRNRYLAGQEEYFRTRIYVTSLKNYPAGLCQNPQLVTGSVACANNYFISFLAGFRHIFGGEMKGYTQLCEEARRFALVRMLQEAEKAGANVVYNVRFETACITSADNAKQSGGVELIAYGTAVRQAQ